MATTPLLTDDELAEISYANSHWNDCSRAIESAVLARVESRIAALAEENGRLTGALHFGGFVRCDIAACNCGSWHARFGWPERFREFTEALEESGANLHTGKTALTILKEMLAERDAARAALQGVMSFLQDDGDSWAEDHPMGIAHALLAALSPTTDGGGTTAEKD